MAYDVILINSDSNQTDITDIATIVLPDVIVFVLSPSTDEAVRAKAVMRRSDQLRSSLPANRSKLLALPIWAHSHIEASTRDAFLGVYAASIELEPYLQAWLPKDLDVLDAVKGLVVPTRDPQSIGTGWNTIETQQVRLVLFDRLASLMRNHLDWTAVNVPLTAAQGTIAGDSHPKLEFAAGFRPGVGRTQRRTGIAAIYRSVIVLLVGCFVSCGALCVVCAYGLYNSTKMAVNERLVERLNVDVNALRQEQSLSLDAIRKELTHIASNDAVATVVRNGDGSTSREIAALVARELRDEVRHATRAALDPDVIAARVVRIIHEEFDERRLMSPRGREIYRKI